MSYAIQSLVYFTKEEWDALEVKFDTVTYIVDYGDRLRVYIGDRIIETFNFSDFTEEQKQDVKSWAQQDAEEAARSAEQSAAQAEQASATASTFAESAEAYAQDASAARGYMDRAETSASTAREAASTAVNAEANAAALSSISQSYAIGESGTRLGENESNARYFAEQAQAAAETARAFAMIVPPACSSMYVERTPESVSVSWADPDSLIINGWKVCDWQRTVAVAKVGTPPTSVDDGTIIAATSIDPSHDTFPLPEGVHYQSKSAYALTPAIKGTPEGMATSIKFFSAASNGNWNDLSENTWPAGA